MYVLIFCVVYAQYLNVTIHYMHASTGVLLAQEVVNKSDIIAIPVELLQTTLYMDIILSHLDDDAIGLQVGVLTTVKCCLTYYCLTHKFNIPVHRYR